MLNHRITCLAAFAAFAVAVTAGPSQAAMAPVPHFADSNIQRTDCAVGFKLGPAGACIIGTDEPHRDQVIEERRSSDEGCETKSVKRSDSMGNSETRTATNCD